MESTERKIVSQNLSGKRLIITRAPHQAASFGSLLEEAGAKVHYLPLIDITPILNAPIPNVAVCFDWVIFTSVNAVNTFQLALQQHGRTITEYSNCNIAAIGEATAEAIREYGLSVDCIPASHMSHALVDTVLEHEPKPRGRRVLMPQGNLAQPVIAEALSDEGMDVYSFSVYRTVTCDISENAMEAAKHFTPHGIAFFSPSAVDAYIATGLRDMLAQVQSDIVHASIGPVTTSALRKKKCAHIAEAQHQNEPSLRDAIIEAFRKG